MKRSFYVDSPPPKRPLKIFAFDPMLGRASSKRITIDIANEHDLRAGPQGSRIAVIDYDATNGCYYAPVNLNDPSILMQGGLDPNESDPRFHQQMVYAVAMKVLENFEQALGRRIFFIKNRTRQRLRIFPHAFRTANAFYDPGTLSLMFGYFRVDENNPGLSLPGQNVFTCLSHDIIAHEMTHALVDRLRKFFIEPTNLDVVAFHEGFSDIVAIFQHFSFQDILRGVIQETRGDLRSPTELIELAREFGYATGTGRALRSAIDRPDPKLYQTLFEPHERGSILVAAVFDAFFVTYQKRIKDLVRIATGGTGQLPTGDLHPDLVNRIAAEASASAQSTLTMCIRAFEYLPPVDITFGDYLRALVTADFELSPMDENGERAAMIEAFRLRGIYPENVASLAEESLVWESAGGNDHEPLDPAIVNHIATHAGSLGTPIDRSAYMTPAPVSKGQELGDAPYNPADPAHDEYGSDLRNDVILPLHDYARRNASKLGLRSDHPISVRGFHTAFRVAPDGQLLIELVAQFAQRASKEEVEKYGKDKLGGVPLRGGTTLIASADGKIRYVISKPLPSPALRADQRKHASERIERQIEFVGRCDSSDPRLPWDHSKEYYPKRIATAMNFGAIHRGIRR